MEDDVISQEVRAGYAYKGRALRPSQVLVNKIEVNDPKNKKKK
jgi:molecular chaperone GrpE (heat shock protein)